MYKKVYLDHNGTTPLLPMIKEQLVHWIEEGWGNPSSIHEVGRKPKELLRKARKQVAETLNVSPLEIIFTSGATESNNTVIQGLIHLSSVHPLLKGRTKIISSNIEHPSVCQVLNHYAQRNQIEWIKIPINREGEWDWEAYERHLGEDVLLVTVMGANNETGIILPISEIAQKAKNFGILVHSDMTQLILKSSIDLKNIDYISFSGHKLYALKGVGVLWVRKEAPFESLIYGGGQERFRRSGTENVLAIASLGVALEYLRSNQSQWIQNIENLRNYMESQLLHLLEGVRITHRNKLRICNTSHLMIDGIDSESLLMKLDLAGFSVSAGSACSSGSLTPSATLMSLGFTEKEVRSSIRVSLGLSNHFSDINDFVETMKNSVEHLRQCYREVNL